MVLILKDSENDSYYNKWNNTDYLPNINQSNCNINAYLPIVLFNPADVGWPKVKLIHAFIRTQNVDPGMDYVASRGVGSLVSK